MTARFFLLLATLAGLFWSTSAASVKAEDSRVESYVSAAKKTYGTNQRSGREARTNKARNYAEKTARHNKNKSPRKQRRDKRHQKQESSANAGVND